MLPPQYWSSLFVVLLTNEGVQELDDLLLAGRSLIELAAYLDEARIDPLLEPSEPLLEPGEASGGLLAERVDR